MPKQDFKYNDSRLWTDLYRIAERHNIGIRLRSLPARIEGVFCRFEHRDYLTMNATLLPGKRELVLASMLGRYKLTQGCSQSSVEAFSTPQEEQCEVPEDRFARLLLRLLSSRYKGGSGGAITDFEHSSWQEAA